MATPDQRAQAQAGLAAWQRGDAASARAAFEAVAAAGVATPALWLLLAQARAVTGAEALVDEALDRVLAQEPRNRTALVMRGDRAADDRAACSFYGLALAGADDQARRDPATARVLADAERKLAAASQRFADHLRETVADHGAGERFDEAIALVTGERELYFQQPTSFFYPGLPHRAFFRAEEFAWADAMTAAADAIRGELMALLEDGDALRPYVQADPTRANRGHALLDDPRWSALHLFEQGEATAVAARCPATMAALAAAPMPHIRGRSPMALFSVLRAGTHIPPHHGMLNTRLICHLPLIVPEDCALRVGADTHAVKRDRLMIFDDSIEHEAWNRSGETRIVLLFEVWRPELTTAECDALTRLFESVGLYAGGQ